MESPTHSEQALAAVIREAVADDRKRVLKGVRALGKYVDDSGWSWVCPSDVLALVKEGA